MSIKKIIFQNKNGENLSGKLELPADQHPHNFVLFAHCFTCTKNLSAIRNISSALSIKGFGVLRFDFTGLGESSGEFEDTNFSGNVEDLIAAATFLETNYIAPTVLIGHSLGGAAAIFAASKINSISAIATIGAPSQPLHVQNLLKSKLEEIQTSGYAVVNLSGRDFTIKKQFLDDLASKSLPETAKTLRKALLILHSPQDQTVSIKNAEEIYGASRHPKSFVSLDGADHLLMNKKDSIYVGEIIASWSIRYVKIPEPITLKTDHQIIASLSNEPGYTAQLKIGKHFMIADEPESVGGNDFGPNPYEYVSAGLAACTAMTIKMYTARKEWDLQHIEVHISHDKTYADDCDNCENTAAKIDTFHREIRIEGNLDEKQRNRIMQIADKCPVHKTLHNEVAITSKLIT